MWSVVGGRWPGRSCSLEKNALAIGHRPLATPIALLLLAATALGQSTEERIIEYELQNSRSWQILSHLTDHIGPRLTATPQAEEAVRWATSQFQNWGIEVRKEPVMVPKWRRGEEQARLVSHGNQPLVITTLGGSVATPPGGITAEVVAVDSFEKLIALGEQARGKIVLFNRPMDATKVAAGRSFEAYSDAVVFRGEGPSKAAAQGAVAALVRSVTTSSLRTPHTGSLRYDEKLPRIPAAAVTTEDADLIQRLVSRGQRVRVFLLLTPRTYPDVQSFNVVAEIKGREKPEEIVLVGGHLDSWDLGTGAIDNGSGVAMVMETMRVIRELNLKPRRTLRAVLFMNEENGLRGAKGYFQRHIPELSRHAAAIETDGGAAAPQGFITTLPKESIEKLKPHLGFLEKVGATELTWAERTGADTSPLVAAGIPGFGLLTESRNYFTYHHTPADTIDKINPRELSMNCAAVAALAWHLAEMPERLP